MLGYGYDSVMGRVAIGGVSVMARVAIEGVSVGPFIIVCVAGTQFSSPFEIKPAIDEDLFHVLNILIRPFLRCSVAFSRSIFSF